MLHHYGTILILASLVRLSLLLGLPTEMGTGVWSAMVLPVLTQAASYRSQTAPLDCIFTPCRLTDWNDSDSFLLDWKQWGWAPQPSSSRGVDCVNKYPTQCWGQTGSKDEWTSTLMVRHIYLYGEAYMPTRWWYICLQSNAQWGTSDLELTHSSHWLKDKLG